jgi:hypothetical protein
MPEMKKTKRYKPFPLPLLKRIRLRVEIWVCLIESFWTSIEGCKRGKDLRRRKGNQWREVGKVLVEI